MTSETPEREREDLPKNGGPNWTKISAIAGVLTLITVAVLGPCGRSEVPLQVEMIAPPEAARSLIVATIREHEFGMPEALLDELTEYCNLVKTVADSLVAERASHLSPEVSGLLDIACESIRDVIYRGYFLRIGRWATIDLRNEGSLVAREVSVRVPGLVTADWQLDGVDLKVIPRQPAPRAYTIEVGNLRPGESALIAAWTSPRAVDTITVFQGAGEIVIKRPQRSAD